MKVKVSEGEGAKGRRRVDVVKPLAGEVEDRK